MRVESQLPTLEQTSSASILGTHYDGAGKPHGRWESCPVQDDDSYVYHTFDCVAAIIVKRQDGQDYFGMFYSLWRVSGEYAGKPK